MDQELDLRCRVGAGEIPSHLVGGLYLRTGPNPVVKPSPYHWFDGDGMVWRAQFLDNTTVALRNRWIVTSSYVERKATGKATSFLGEIQYPFRALRALAKLVNSTYYGTALTATTGNTALLWWQNRLFALMEAAVPMEVDPVTLEALGLFRFQGQLRTSMTAHPKQDAASKELIFFG